MLAEHPICLACDETTNRCDPCVTWIARYCDFYLDGELLPEGLLFAADEKNGEVALLQVEKRDGPCVRFVLNPETKRPVLEYRRGRVEIRLKATAPQEVGWAFHDLRYGIGGREIASYRKMYLDRLEIEDAARSESPGEPRL